MLSAMSGGPPAPTRPYPMGARRGDALAGAAVWRVGDAAFELRGAVAHHTRRRLGRHYCGDDVDYYTGGAPSCARSGAPASRASSSASVRTISNGIVRADNLSALAAAVGAVAAPPLATVDLLGSGGACARACGASARLRAVARRAHDALVARELAQ